MSDRQFLVFRAPWGDENADDIARLEADGFPGGAWETFTLWVHGEETGDMRQATEDDLRRLGWEREKQ